MIVVKPLADVITINIHLLYKLLLYFKLNIILLLIILNKNYSLFQTNVNVPFHFSG